MTALALLLAALATPGGVPSQAPAPEKLLQSFRTFCLNDGANRRDAAAAAGFAAVPLSPPGDTGQETAAWEKDGIRIFELAARSDPRLPLPTMCGASADIGHAGNDDALSTLLLALPDYVFMETTAAWGQAHWNLILRRVGRVQVFIDRRQPTDVSMTFTVCTERQRT